MRSELFLLQMAGLMGVGKSTLARLIGQNTGAVVIDKDVVMSAALDAGAVWESATRVSYETLRALADSLLRQRLSVILDSPCFYQNIVDEGSAIARRHGATYAYVECVLSDASEHRRRLHTRPRLRTQGLDFGVPPPDAPMPAPGTIPGTIPNRQSRVPSSTWLRVDMGRPLDRCLAEALAYLGNLG